MARQDNWRLVSCEGVNRGSTQKPAQSCRRVALFLFVQASMQKTGDDIKLRCYPSIIKLIRRLCIISCKLLPSAGGPRCISFLCLLAVRPCFVPGKESLCKMHMIHCHRTTLEKIKHTKPFQQLPPKPVASSARFIKFPCMNHAEEVFL